MIREGTEVHRILRVAGGGNQLGQLLRGSAAALAFRVLGMAGFLGTAVLVSRWHGQDQFGIFSLGLAVLILGSMVSKLGTDHVLMKLHAQYADEGAWGASRTLHHHVLVIVTVSGAACTLAVALSAEPMATALFAKPELAASLRVAALGILPLAWMNVLVNSIRGFGGLMLFGWAKFAFVQVSTLGFVVVHRLVDSGLPLIGCYVAAAGLGFLCAALSVLRSFARTGPSNDLVGPSATRVLRLSILLALAAGGYVAIEWTGSLILGRYGTSADVGDFQAAFRLAAVLNTPALVVTSSVAAQLSVLHARGRLDPLRALAQLTSALVLAATLPAAVVLALMPDTFLGLFGEGAETARVAMLLLIASQIAAAAGGTASYLLIMAGGEQAVQLSVAAALVVNVGLNILLVPRHGAGGAALTQLITLSLMSGLALVAARLRFGFWALPTLSSVRPGQLRLLAQLDVRTL